MKKLIFFWKELMSTFWFVPSGLVVLSILLAFFMLYVDLKLEFAFEGFEWLLLSKNVDSARGVLSTVAGAMINITGMVFSATLVALTLASSQYGSRLIKNFMYVRLNQVVIGLYISTFVYCLVVLNTIKANDDMTQVPALAIVVAVLLAIAAIILLIFFIHNIATSIQASNVIDDISNILRTNINALFPDKIGKGIEETVFDEADISKIKGSYPLQQDVTVGSSGYMQYVDSDSILFDASEEEILLELTVRPGMYVVENSKIGVLYSKEEKSEEVIHNMLDSLVVGNKRVAQQDIEFSIQQMVEIAARALSPGINDPFTAINCIDSLSRSLSALAQVKFPSGFRFDDKNNLRIIAKAIDFEGVLDAGFNQIRQFSAGNVAVIIRLMESLISIDQFATTAEQKNAIKKHAQMVLAVGKRSISEEYDLASLQERADKIC